MLNIMNPPADWSTLKKLIWLRGTPISGGEELTVSGAPPLSLPNSLGKPLKAWSVDVLPKQDLNGYDAPWPAGGGKNKLKPSFIQGSAISLGRADRIVSDTYIPVTQGLTYTFSADNYSDFYYVLNTGENNTLPIDGSFQYCGNSADWANQDITFTATASGYMWVVIRNTDANNIVPSDVANVKMQVEINSSATSYSPYSNICPIHGTDKLTITTAGKNLFDQSVTPTFMDVYDLGGTPLNRRGYKINLPAGTYKLSATKIDSLTTAAYIYICINNADGSYRSFIYFIAGATTSADTTIVLTEGQYFMMYDAQATTIGSTNKLAWYNFQVENGTTVTDYEPYQGSSAVLTLPQTVYTGTIGSEGGESRWGEVDLGTLSWHSTSPYMIAALPLAKKPQSNTDVANMMAEKYHVVARNSTNNTNDTAIDTTGTLFVRTSETPSGMLVYELATPTTFSITTPTIPTPTGTATTWATAEDGTVDSMEVTYIGKA